MSPSFREIIRNVIIITHTKQKTSSGEWGPTYLLGCSKMKQIDPGWYLHSFRRQQTADGGVLQKKKKSKFSAIMPGYFDVIEKWRAQPVSKGKMRGSRFFFSSLFEALAVCVFFFFQWDFGLNLGLICLIINRLIFPIIRKRETGCQEANFRFFFSSGEQTSYDSAQSNAKMIHSDNRIV